MSGATHPSSVRARRSSKDLATARGGETAVECQAEMWLMRVADFLALETLESHQDMLAQNKLWRWFVRHAAPVGRATRARMLCPAFRPRS